MAVDLSLLVESLQREVNSPGGDSFPNANEDVYLGHLMDAFWEAMAFDGLFTGYTVSDAGIVTPTSGTTDLSRELQQVIVFYAGIRMIRNQLLNMGTLFRAKAGPVEYETQNSAQMMKAILDELKGRRDNILDRLGDSGSVATYYIDALREREASIESGLTYWWDS